MKSKYNHGDTETQSKHGEKPIHFFSVLSLCLRASVVCIFFTATVRADKVVLKNGDTLNGKVGEVSGGKMKFSSPVLGDITIELKNIEQFTTDEPAVLQPKATTRVSGKITEGNDKQVTLDDDKSFALEDIKYVNPPAQKWTGSIVGLAALARGNTDTFDVGISINAVLRRDDDIHDDRFTFGGAYNFGTTGRGDDTTTNTDNWFALVKYDRFLSPKLYTYAQMKIEHDRIAALTYRLSPGVGLGYQWFDQPDFHFNTEIGLTYIYEQYDIGGSDDHIALRLAYHVDKQLAENVKLFHNLEFLPDIVDPGDYNLTTDAGIRTDLTKSFFTEFKVELKRDSTPADGAMKNDLRYVVGVGWSF